MREMISFKEVESRILVIQNEKALLDRGVAELYGVEVKRVNEAVRRNPDKFPDGYIVTLAQEDRFKLVANCDRFDSLKHSTALPTAFTEKGLYMLATILKSSRATQTTLAIVETFSKLRELSRIMSELPETQEESRQKTLMQKSGELLAEVLDDNVLEVSGDETTIELNLALMKVKHTIKREKKK